MVLVVAVLVRFLRRIELQEWLLYQVAILGERAQTAHEISVELDAVSGKPSTLKPYAPVLDYHRLAPPFIGSLRWPRGRSGVEVAAAAKVMGCLRLESQRRHLEEVARGHTGDAEEAWAIGHVFGGRRKPIPVVAVKSYFGNLGAGSGMVELIAGALALKHNRLFPVLNYRTPDPQCPVAAVTNGSVLPGGSFINLSVTPQGQASAALVGRFEP